MQTSPKTLIYSCSGCSSAGQMANRIAVNLDRRGIAEMSCIAGVGGGVPHLVKKAQAASNIIAIDGCALGCAKACLLRAGISPGIYYELRKLGAKKSFHEDYDLAECRKIEEQILRDLEPRLSDKFSVLNLVDLNEPARRRPGKS